MASHAKVHGRETGSRSAVHSVVTLGALNSDFVDVMNFVRKIDRLLRLRPNVQKMFSCIE